MLATRGGWVRKSGKQALYLWASGKSKVLLTFSKKIYWCPSYRKSVVERERKTLPSTLAFHKWLREPGLRQDKVKSKVLHPSPTWSAWTTFCCFAQAISEQQDQKRNSFDTNRCSYGMLTSQATVLLARLWCLSPYTHLEIDLQSLKRCRNEFPLFQIHPASWLLVR